MWIVTDKRTMVLEILRSWPDCGERHLLDCRGGKSDDFPVDLAI